MRCNFCGNEVTVSGYSRSRGVAFCSAVHEFAYQEQEARASLGSLLLHVQAANAASRVGGEMTPLEQAARCLERVRESRTPAYPLAATLLFPAAFPELAEYPRSLEAWLPAAPAAEPGQGAKRGEAPAIPAPPKLDMTSPFEPMEFQGPPPLYPVLEIAPLRSRYCYGEAPTEPLGRDKHA